MRALGRSSSLLTCLLLVTGCDPGPPPVLETAHTAVDVAPDARAHADLTMAGGDLQIFVGEGGPAAEAHFQFDWAPMRPVLALDANATPPLVRIHQPELPEEARRSHNIWKVSYDGSRVTRLAITQGVGACSLTVTGSRTEELDVRLGTGALSIDLTGVVRSLKARIELNNGRLVLALPHRHGVKVHRKIVMGYATLNGEEQKDAVWTSANYDTAPIRVDLDALVLGGEIEMKTQ
jgi:hypothetical protein